MKVLKSCVNSSTVVAIMQFGEQERSLHFLRGQMGSGCVTKYDSAVKISLTRCEGHCANLIQRTYAAPRASEIQISYLGFVIRPSHKRPAPPAHKAAPNVPHTLSPMILLTWHREVWQTCS